MSIRTRSHVGAGASASSSIVRDLSPATLRRLYETLHSENDRGRAYWTDEQYVPDVTVTFLYQQHTITALAALIIFALYSLITHTSDEETLRQNLRAGVTVAASFVVILGMIVFPSGPFIRPHPILWRIAFAVGVLYQIALFILLFCSLSQARYVLTFFHSELNTRPMERAYAEDCDFTVSNVLPAFFDQYALSHFLGWAVKSLMVRDQMLCWIMSVQWELIELALTYLLPNFAECWWDQWFMDVLVCNGLGIFAGHHLSLYLEMKQYEWRGVDSYPDALQKAQRVLLQFTPASWIKVRWHWSKNLGMFVFLHFLVLCMHCEELNAFMLKHILWIPPPNPLNLIRLVIWAFIGVPALRQVYTFMTDPQCRRIGMHTFLALSLLTTEVLIIVKFYPHEETFKGKIMPTHIQRLVASCALVWFVWSAYMIHGIVTNTQIIDERTHNDDKQHNGTKNT